MYRTLSHVSVCGPAFPRSCYEGWTPPLSATSEAEALAELKYAHQRGEATTEAAGYITFILDDFTIHRGEHKSHAYQLCSLDRLNNRRGFNELAFDGVLSTGEERRFVEGVRFETLAIEGYGDLDVTDMRGHICIRSREATKQNVWYQLGKPSNEYRRFFNSFLWLSQFTKYFVDYLLENEHVTLQHFHRDFYEWLFERYSTCDDFTSWLSMCNLRDFRTTVAAYVGFLWKECHSIDDNDSGLLKHRIWGEVDPAQLSAIPRQQQREKHTIVTPFAYDCFKHMYFSGHLEARKFSDHRTRAMVARRKQELNLTPLWTEDREVAGLMTPTSMPDESQPTTLNVMECDVISIRPDTKGWRSTSSTWYAYVQGTRSSSGTTKLDVIWLYEPQDTTLGKAYYPYGNELFFSDNCECGKSAIDISAVISKVSVTFFENDPSACGRLFVRQKFRTTHTNDTYDFVSLQQSDFKCGCKNVTPVFEECKREYGIGDTVLYRQYNSGVGEDGLEPGQIIDFLHERQRIVLRKLLRSTSLDPQAKPNQLFVSDEYIEKPATMIIRKCHVRYFHSDAVQEGLPTPYNQNGAGDFYFVVTQPGPSRLQTPASERPHQDNNRLLNLKGWDTNDHSPSAKLTGMGIFCGGGNLDRGLEDGGAVEFEHAIDFAEHALHTYRANSKNPEGMNLFLGSVDDYLAQAIAGSTRSVIARIGDVDVLAAGSPCPGFSQVNVRKHHEEKALRNSSMVASVISYVDLYSPKYCFLENVVPMTQGMGPNKDENVFAQMLAVFVAMGYQVQQFLMESWSFGSSQSRARVFIVASAPGLEPLDTPPYTHGHPKLGMPLRNSKLGVSSNGKAFGRRRDEYTPFAHVSPLDATKDLPDIGDSLPQICPSHPDHRTSSDPANLAFECMAVVPTHPRGLGLVMAIKEAESLTATQHEDVWCSAITGRPRELYEEKIKINRTRNKEGSKVYSRVFPDRLFPTVLTVLHTNDGISGRTLHWEQSRTLTIMELRRAQGFLDHEVIIGQPNDQARIIGNSVDRKASLPLGLGLRQSWLKSRSQSDRCKHEDKAVSIATDGETSHYKKAFVLVERN